MTAYREKFEFWKNDLYFDQADREELARLTDEKEIEDRFYKDLEFGTGGLRGVMAPGSNRMNKYNIRRATAGFAAYLLKKYGEDAKKRGVAIAKDPRHNSTEFALETALTMAAFGIPAAVYTMLSPTPLLSWTVRRLGCVGGVVITSSHNTKEYNGYKAYDDTGCQLYTDASDAVTAEISAIDITSVRPMDEAQARSLGLLRDLGQDLMDEYIETVQKQAHPLAEEAKKALRIVYTPLHGAGFVPTTTVLRAQGYTDLSWVEAQAVPDGDFPTLVSPNPEEKAALAMAIQQAEEKDADLIIANDPDSDRIGIAVRHGGEYIQPSGNQQGIILLNYLAERRAAELTEKTTLITTIVTGQLAKEIAAKKGIRVFESLTGFKYICRRMAELDKSKGDSFLMGYEESFGYLIGEHARDKDGVVSAMIFAEMAAYYKAQGKTLIDVLDELYREYGYYLDLGESYVLRGKDGAEQIKAITAAMRQRRNELFPGTVRYEDYSQGVGGQPLSDVQKFYFEDGSWVAGRPSGTEPKIKFYYSIKGADKNAASERCEALRAVVKALVEEISGR